MPSRNKLLERMKANPRADWQMRDVETLTKQIGGEVLNAKGSHYKICLLDGKTTFTIPAHKPIKPVYIKKLVALIEASETL